MVHAVAGARPVAILRLMSARAASADDAPYLRHLGRPAESATGFCVPIGVHPYASGWTRPASVCCKHRFRHRTRMPTAERFVRSIKDECLHHVIPFGERHLRCTMPNTSSTTTVSAITRDQEQTDRGRTADRPRWPDSSASATRRVLNYYAHHLCLLKGPVERLIGNAWMRTANALAAAADGYQGLRWRIWRRRRD